MNLSVSHRGLVLAIAMTAIAGLYFASTGVAEAQVGSTGINRTASSTMASSTRPKAINATCMSAAVEVRETALISALNELNTSLAEKLTVRKDALVTAWSLSDVAARGKAIRAAFTTWKKDKMTAHTEFKSDRKAAWDTFKTTAKSQCKVTLPKEEMMETASKDSIAL